MIQDRYPWINTNNAKACNEMTCPTLQRSVPTTLKKGSHSTHTGLPERRKARQKRTVNSRWTPLWHEILYGIEHRSGKRGQFLTNSQDTRHKDSVPELQLISLSTLRRVPRPGSPFKNTSPKGWEETTMLRRMSAFSSLLCQTSKCSSNPLSSSVS